MKVPIQYPMGSDPLPENLNQFWEEFFKSEDTRKPGEDIYHDVFDSPLLFPLQRRKETVRMMRTARKVAPTVVYEIGADKGGGLYHWCKCFPTVKRVIACEVRGTPYCDLFEKAFPHIDFLWIPASSYADSSVSAVAGWLGRDRINCLFIDGDKSGFLKDFDVYRPYVTSPGIIFMHDFRDEGPSRSYNIVKTRGYINEEILDISEYDEEMKKPSPETVHAQWLRYWHGRSAGVGVFYV